MLEEDPYRLPASLPVAGTQAGLAADKSTAAVARMLVEDTLVSRGAGKSSALVGVWWAEPAASSYRPASSSAVDAVRPTTGQRALGLCGLEQRI